MVGETNSETNAKLKETVLIKWGRTDRGTLGKSLYLSESQVLRGVVQDKCFSNIFVSGHFTLLKIIEDYSKLLFIMTTGTYPIRNLK